MKRNRLLCLLAVCLMCGMAFSQEQEKKQLPREVPSPEKSARKMTDRMKDGLQLTDKQYDKLYKLNLKEQQERFAAMAERGEGQRPPRGEQRGECPGMGGGRPPVGTRGERPAMSKDNAEKKIKKILTAEQYAKWQEMRQPQEPLQPQDHPQEPNL